MIYLSLTTDEHGEISEETLDNPVSLEIQGTESGSTVTSESMLYLVADSDSPNPYQIIRAYTDVKISVRQDDRFIKVEVAPDEGGSPGKYSTSLMIAGILSVQSSKAIPFWVRASMLDDGTIMNKNFIGTKLEVSGSIRELSE